MSRKLKLPFAVLGAAALLSGCSRSNSSAIEPKSSCSMPSASESTDSLPADFPQPEGVLVTRTVVRKQFVTVEGYARTTVDDLFEVSRDAVIGERFDIINTDYEGFEAEIYFARASSIAGIVRLREGPCDGYVSLSVLYDPLTTEKGREAVDKTRDLTGNATPGTGS